MSEAHAVADSASQALSELSGLGDASAQPLRVSESQGLSQEQAGATAAASSAEVRRLADIVALRADFQAAYVSTRAAKWRKKAAGQEEELAPELDAFVNAATRPFKCYRLPIMAYYGNDRIGKLHLAMWVRIWLIALYRVRCPSVPRNCLLSLRRSMLVGLLHPLLSGCPLLQALNSSAP